MIEFAIVDELEDEQNKFLNSDLIIQPNFSNYEFPSEIKTTDTLTE